MAGIGYGPMPWLIIGTSAPSDYYGNHAVLGVDIHGSTVPGRHRGRQIDYCWYCCNLCGIYFVSGIIVPRHKSSALP